MYRKYNPEWEHSPNGRATAYLATLVCRYMHELQQKDKKVSVGRNSLFTLTLLFAPPFTLAKAPHPQKQ